MRAFTPTRPTFFMSLMLAIPCTTVQKMIGAISILIILMNASPNGFICSPSPGLKWPSATPAAIAVRT